MMVLGLSLGSFVNALVWRLYMQSKRQKTTKQKTKDQGLSTKDFSILHGRSMCVHCHHTLAWYDLVPVFSWVSLKGRCRYCRKPISWQYPLVEVLTAVLFAVSYIFWPHNLASGSEIALFGLWLAMLVIAVALGVYDMKWMLLPNRLVYMLAVLAVLFVFISGVNNELDALMSNVIGAATYGGAFWLLYTVSSGKWIGFGDVRLSFVLGLLLGWKLAFLSLIIASYAGTMVFLVLFLAGRYRRNQRIPFGPLLLGGAFIAMLWGGQIIDWYLCLSGCTG